MNTTTRIHLGSGGRDIGHSFTSYDQDVNIFAPLPWPSDYVQFIVCSHTAEHGSPGDAWNFFKECYRILRKGGVVRITVPDAIKAHRTATQSYIDWVGKMGWSDGTRRGVLDALLNQHGHKGIFTPGILVGLLEAAGFRAKQVGLHHSDYPELAASHHHNLQIGTDFDVLESICAEGVKS
jgi:SAM-dependent methyltransferase